MNVVKGIYVLFHGRDLDEDENGPILIGVFETEELVNNAISNLKEKPGFKDNPDDFNFEYYELNKIHWSEGFISM